MAFKTKQDYFGLSSVDGLVITDTSENKSAGMAEAKDEAGFVIATQMLEEQSAPSCSYVVTKNLTLSNIVLGQKTKIQNKNYVVGSITINTSAGSPVTLEASGQQVEDEDGSGCTASIPSITLSALHHAQNFGAFTISGQGAHLTSSTLTIGGQVSTADKDGKVIASDLTDGRMTISGTIQVSDPTYPTPTLSLSDGWSITSPLTENNPNGEFPTFSFGLTRYLDHTEPNS